MSNVNETKPHAREPDEGAPDGVMAQRIAAIVDLKMRLRYRRRTAERLAEEWGVEVGYVHQLSSKANAIVRKAAVDPDALAADLLPDLVATYRAASRDVRKGVDPHARAKMAASVASLGTLLAEIGGLKAPKTSKHEVTGADGGPVAIQTGVLVLPPEADE